MAGKLPHIFVLLLFACAQIRISSAVCINIHPDTISELTTGPVSMSCVPDINQAVVHKILVMEIAKSGAKPIAIARQNSKIVYGKGAVTRFKAEGQVNDNVNESFLNLTLLNPIKADSGTYTCVMYFMDDSGLVADERDSGNLTVARDDISSVITVVEKQRKMLSDLEGKLVGLSTTLVQLNQALSAEKNNVAGLSTTVAQLHQELSSEKSNVASLSATVGQLRRELTLQESKIANLPSLERRVVALKEKVTCQSAFSASNNGLTDPSEGYVIQFPDVTMSLGPIGYDASSSTFTAPMDGLYAFNMALELACKKYCNYYIDLKVNNLVVGIMKIGNYYITDQSALSTVVKLNKWDRVQAVVRYDHGASLTNGKSILFSGFLIKCF